MMRMGTPWPGQPRGRGRRWRRRNYARPRQRRRQAGLGALGSPKPISMGRRTCRPATPPRLRVGPRAPPPLTLTIRCTPPPVGDPIGGGPVADLVYSVAASHLLLYPDRHQLRSAPPPPSCSISVVAGLRLGGSRRTGGGFVWWRI